MSMFGLISKVYCVQRGPFKSLLLFLCHLAWKSRIRLPALIAVGFMVLDLRMQLEINIDLGMGGRQGIPPGQGNQQGGAILIDDTDSEDTLGDDDSVSTDPSSYHSSSTSDDDDDIPSVECPVPLRISDLELVGSSANIVREDNQEDG